MFVFFYKYCVNTIDEYIITLKKKSLKKIPPSKKQKEQLEYWDKIESSLWDKLDIQDVIDVPDRTLKIDKKNTDWDKITADLQDTSSNTSQYIKIINAHLKDKKSRIEKIINLADNFEQEIKILQSDNEKIHKLRNTPIHEFKSDKLKTLAQELIKDREKRTNILKKLKNDIIKAEEELHQSNKQIERINDEILEKELNKNKI